MARRAGLPVVRPPSVHTRCRRRDQPRGRHADARRHARGARQQDAAAHLGDRRQLEPDLVARADALGDQRRGRAAHAPHEVRVRDRRHRHLRRHRRRHPQPRDDDRRRRGGDRGVARLVRDADRCSLQPHGARRSPNERVRVDRRRLPVRARQLRVAHDASAHHGVGGRHPGPPSRLHRRDEGDDGLARSDGRHAEGAARSVLGAPRAEQPVRRLVDIGGARRAGGGDPQRAGLRRRLLDEPHGARWDTARLDPAARRRRRRRSRTSCTSRSS